MADNKKYYYMKLKENFFDSDEMIILETMSDGYLYSNILLKLYLRSLKDGGSLMFKGVIPYTPDVLAKVLRHNVGVVEKAIQVFQNLGLVEVLDNGAIYMLDIQNFIGKSSTEADRKRDYRSKIENEKLLLGHLSGHLSDESTDKSTPELKIEKEIESESKNDTLLDDFDKVRKAYAELHQKLDMPYTDSPILTRLLEDGFSAELIIGIMKDKYKSTVKTLKFYEGAIRDTAEVTGARRQRPHTYYEHPSDKEAKHAARMAKMQTNEYGSYPPVFDPEVS